MASASPPAAPLSSPTTSPTQRATSEGLVVEKSRKGAYQARLACEVGLRNFPFLKPWVAKLENFVAPTEVGSTEGSLFFAVGATSVAPNVIELWQKDAYRLNVDWKGKGGTIESGWLGPFPKDALGKVKPGPGYATVQESGSSSTQPSSEMGARRAVVSGQTEPALSGYAAEIIRGKPGAALTGAWPRFWSELFSSQELELLEKCTEQSCKIKLGDEERKAVAGSSHQYRVAKFQQQLQKRVEEFQKFGRVWAYEGAHGPMDWQDLPVSSIFPTILDTHFWIPKDRGSLAYDVLDAEPGHHKPVTGLFSRQCEKRGQGAKAYTACTDIGLYNNHYFDFWARLVYFFPWCDVQVALVYETLDIDQIKESRVVRVLFGAEMRKLMGQLLETRLKRLHMLGS